MNQAQDKSADAFLARDEQALELREQAPRREEQRFGVRRLARQIQARRKARRRREKRMRFRQPAAGTVEGVEQSAAAALPEAFARQREGLADHGDSDAAKDLEVEAGDLERQRLEPRPAAARAPQSGEAGRRDGKRGGHAELVQPVTQRGEE